ncbi:ABC transporter ATP-binding protein [Enterococcus sp.]|uniref:ABC transporter ATP-binding protein n=1 Tax=Enterococcus sp. TaxID=35783 RepID=UPI0028AE0D43|nr:ABC transporter ATP-binding protein [Enterococcus sp.]
MIHLTDIKKTYQTGDAVFTALDVPSFQCQQGELLAIIGESGSDKTTLLRILGLLDHCDSGSYRIKDQAAEMLTHKQQAQLRNQMIGFVLQHFGLIADYTVKENILLPTTYLPRHLRKEKAAQLDTLCAAMEIDDQLKKYPNRLSRGQQQRVAIARALINDPAILLADEPTGNLDSRNSQLVLDILRREHQKGKTVIIVTHEQAIADACDRQIVMKDGKLEERSVCVDPV